MTAKRIFFIAGEASGDVLGARLIAALRRRSPDEVLVDGVGGPLMAEQGLVSRFPMSELSLLGIAEILPHIPNLIRRISETVAAIRENRPDAVVTIDAPAFGLRVAARLAGTGIPRIHYVAPQLWAWRPGRARKLGRKIDRLLGLLPFEPDFFARYGIECSFVGHPVIEGGAGQGDGAGFRQRHGIAADAPLLVVLPGSRRGEINRLLSIFGLAVAQLAARHPGLRVVLPTLPGVAPQIRDAVADWPVPARIVDNSAEKFDAFAAASVAIAASGTVTLELALSGTPSVVAYRLHAISALLAKRLLTVRQVALVNIVLGRDVVPELLLDRCTPEGISAELDRLLSDEAARNAQQMAFRAVAAQLATPGLMPSDMAADAVLAAIAAQNAAK